MSQYKVIIKEEAQTDLKNLLRYEPKAYKKAIRFIGELYDHPMTGLGHPEPLKGKPEGRWSREITKNTDLFIAFSKQKSMLTYSLPTAIMMTSDIISFLKYFP